VVPHAGYVYSGAIAAVAYTLLEDAELSKVVLIGPSHFEPFQGLAGLDASFWITPLGSVALAPVPHSPRVSSVPEAYRREHSLEVQLPFLQTVLDSFFLLPLLTGYVAATEVAEVLDDLLSAEALLVVSTDLSHYEDYENARELDRATAAAALALDAEALRSHQACGVTGLRGAVLLAADRDWGLKLLDLRSSGDTAGSRRQVVGYGAFALVG
jgi:AmmeMemoRadiSam system protein B